MITTLTTSSLGVTQPAVTLSRGHRCTTEPLKVRLMTPFETAAAGGGNVLITDHRGLEVPLREESTSV